MSKLAPKIETQEASLLSRCWCTVELAALRHNVQALRARLQPQVAVMAIVKADGYGHGIIPVAQAFEAAGCAMLGCASAQEGVQLRAAGIRLPILVLSSFLEEELEAAAEALLTLTVSSRVELECIDSFARVRELRLPVHLKVDTGMGRLGCRVEEAEELIAIAQACEGIALEGVFSHLSCAGESEAFSREQQRRFEEVGVETGLLRHLCNSAGTLHYAEAHYDMVRTGLLLYGGVSDQDFRPAMQWRCKVVAVRELDAGATLSYGATYTAPRRMRVATLSVGYGDGYLRGLSNQASVILAGKRCPVVGRVTMDAIMVDVSDCAEVEKGSVATLLGEEGRERISLEELAQWAQAIPYEIWCSITRRVQRLYC